MAFQVSSATINITPTLAMNPFMGGYGCQDGGRAATTATPHQDPLKARCIVLWDANGPHALISVEILAIPRPVYLALLPRLVALAPWQQADIVLQATHTHNGPALTASLNPYTSYGLSDLGPLQAYTAWLQDQIVAVVTNALSAAKTSVTLDYTVSSTNFAFNREGLPYAETDVPIITARTANGTPRAVIFSYGCHPVSAGWQNQYDGDWPAGACHAIEASLPGCAALFVQGAAGDQDPMGVRGWSLRDALGSGLGGTVVAAVQTPGNALTGPISTQYTESQLPIDVETTAANLAAVRACFVARMPNPQGQPFWYQRHAQLAAALIDSGNVTTRMPNGSQVWQWQQGGGTLTLALTGGELVSGFAVYFRNIYGGSQQIIVGGYANNVDFYVPSNALLPPLATGGSYAGGWDPDYPGIAGGNLTVYPQVGHFLAGGSGVESAIIGTLTAQLGG